MRDLAVRIILVQLVVLLDDVMFLESALALEHSRLDLSLELRLLFAEDGLSVDIICGTAPWLCVCCQSSRGLLANR